VNDGLDALKRPPARNGIADVTDQEFGFRREVRRP
jgi:hypothetical protein